MDPAVFIVCYDLMSNICTFKIYINEMLSIDNSNKVLLPLLAKCHKEIVTNLHQV